MTGLSRTDGRDTRRQIFGAGVLAPDTPPAAMPFDPQRFSTWLVTPLDSP